MLISNLQQFASETPDKQAIVYKGKAISYAKLWEEIEFRSHEIAQIPQKNFLLTHTNELENLLNFLAGISIGKVGIFAGKHLNNSQLSDLEEKHGAFILNENLRKQSSLFSNQNSSLIRLRTPLNSSLKSLFLGVLTSGTTSTPSLIWKDFQSWFTAFPHQSEVFDINKTDRLFVLDALSYSANLNSVLHMLWLGGTVVLTALSSANTWSQQIEKEKVTSVFMVPSHHRLLVKNVGKNPEIKSIVSAGEKLDTDLAQKLIDFAPNSILTEYYGSAELGHITYHQNNEIIENPLSVGKPFPEVKIELENDQIFVDSPYISPDFRKVKTNFDLGYFIDNQLILMGRAGRMFNRRGLNIFAEEIENVVKKLPFIIEAAAIGILEIDNSHEIFLAYICTTGFQNNINNDKIISHLASHLQATKIPNRIQEFENLPRTDFGKIDFKALARTFEAEIFA
jgi:long-chain acyl-CoA synthetase